jgi:hypothetical protein
MTEAIATARTALLDDDAVDAILREDPAGAYARMDAASRERYLHAVRTWAGRANRPADDVARTVIALATGCAGRHGATDRRAHVGYFLIDAGIADLAAALGTKPGWRERIRLRPASHVLLAYYGAFFSLCLGLGILSVGMFDFDLSLTGRVAMSTLVALYICPIVQGWVHLLLPRLFEAQRMPRMDFGSGIPASEKTLVAIPCLLTSREGVRRLGHALEALYRDNREAGAGYALLSDFVDAPARHMDDDDALLDEARAMIAALNERHGGGFVLLHRSRRWNAADGIWMGWERKRGKLEELNAHLVGGPSPFETRHGDLGRLEGVRYVFVLDEDNHDLTPGAIQQLAATLTHPLHRPVFGDSGVRLEAGYTLLQPRATIVLSRDTAPSRLERLVQSMMLLETGQAVSGPPPANTDMALYGQVPYVGKGFYDVAAFHRIMHGRVPENSTLNHDVLEGGTVRAAVVGDIVLHDTFTPTFFATANRTHRWMRGDWQLLPWLLPTVRDASGARIENALSPFGRWQIFYNGLRMTMPTAALLCFAIGWLTSPTPGAWTLYLLAIAWLPALLVLAFSLLRRLPSLDPRSTALGAWAWLSLRSAGFIFAVDQARITLDAAVRCTYRMLVSHRGMLEWTPSSVIAAQRDPTLAQYLRMMWTSPAFAVAVTWLVARTHPSALWSSVPFAVLWSMAPVVAWWWSRTPEGELRPLRPSQA